MYKISLHELLVKESLKVMHGTAPLPVCTLVLDDSALLLKIPHLLGTRAS